MIRWRVPNTIERFARNGDDMRLANLERVRMYPVRRHESKAVMPWIETREHVGDFKKR